MRATGESLGEAVEEATALARHQRTCPVLSRSHGGVATVQYSAARCPGTLAAESARQYWPNTRNGCGIGRNSTGVSGSWPVVCDAERIFTLPRIGTEG